MTHADRGRRASLFFPLAAVLLTSWLASGCATTSGVSYNALSLPRLELGKTPKSQVVAMIGAPMEEETVTYRKDMNDKELPQPKVGKMMRYRFSAPSAAGAVAGSPPTRWVNVILIDDAVVAYFASSSFKEDSSDFDVSQASKLEKGKSTKDSVLASLGTPSGKGIYPFAVSPQGTGYFYSVDLRNIPAGSNTRKRVQVYFDDKGLVEDFNVNAKSEVAPVAPVSTPITVYVPAPARIK